MEGGGLVVEHHVVRPRDAHDEIDARRAQQGQQHVHVVLVRFGMVGVADVAAHGHAEQLAAEVILQAGADDLLAVVEVLGADEADHGVHQQRPEFARHGVGAHLAGLLIDAMVGACRKSTALPRLEIHEVVAQGAAALRQPRFVTFLQQRQADAKALVGALGPGDGLEHQIHGRAAFDGGDAGSDVGQHAGLGRDLIALDHRIEHLQQLADAARAVGGRVDADHRIAVAVKQAVEDAGGDAGRIVGGVIGLQPGGQPPTQADGVAETGHHADFLGHQDQVLDAHDLGHRGDHLRGQSRGQRSETRLVRRRAEQPVAKAAHGEMGDRREGLGIVAVDDQPGDFVGLVGNHRLAEKVLERQLGQGHLRRHPLHVAAGGDPGQDVPGTRRGGLGQQVLEIGETPGLAAHAVLETAHATSRVALLRPRQRQRRV